MAMRTSRILSKGFTLIEMLLVMVIISAIIYMGAGYLQQRALQLKIDKTVAQVQQILNAAVVYYIANNNTWPIFPPFSTYCLQGYFGCQAYLPTTMTPPFWMGGIYYSWGGGSVFAGQSNAVFYVAFPVNLAPPKSYSVATIIAGMLPTAFTSSDIVTPGSCNTGNYCWVTATITAPAQSLVNSTNVGYAGLYHSGACVQAPSCPPDPAGNPMQPSVMVVPASVTGVNDMPGNIGAANCSPTSTSGCQVTAYPLNSFTAYATGPSSAAGGPPTCASPAISAPCTQDYTGTLLPANNYWRVCLAVATQKGFVQPSGSPTQQNVWGQVSGTVMVITRCSPTTEANGSNFTVWAN
jgi:prepilin-type N-terminal cleavage/methylation domain-containing protein